MIFNKRLFLRLLGPVIFLAIIYFFVDVYQLKDILLRIRFKFFALSIALVPLLVFVRSMRWKRILSKFSIKYPTAKCFRVYFVEMITIMIAATVGTFIKAIYLKRDGYGFSRPILSIISEKYFDYLLPFVFGITSIVLFKLNIYSNISIVILLLVAFLVFVPIRRATIFILYRMIPGRMKKLFLVKGWDLSRHMPDIERSLDCGTYVFSIAGFSVYFLTVYYVTKSLNINLDFAQVVLIMSITSLVTILPVSFFGIGTWDVGLLVTFKLFGHGAAEAIALSIALLFLRVAIVLMGLIFWIVDPPPFFELKALK